MCFFMSRSAKRGLLLFGNTLQRTCFWRGNLGLGAIWHVSRLEFMPGLPLWFAVGLGHCAVLWCRQMNSMETYRSLLFLGQVGPTLKLHRAFENKRAFQQARRHRCKRYTGAASNYGPRSTAQRMSITQRSSLVFLQSRDAMRCFKAQGQHMSSQNHLLVHDNH